MSKWLSACKAFSVAAIVAVLSCSNQAQRKAANPHEETDWLFEKKFRCASLRPAIEKLYEGSGSKTFVGELFYSPKLNTCIFNTTAFENKILFVEINDALTGANIFSSNEPGAGAELQKRLAELKEPSKNSN
jgi:hypothetical protein